MIALPGEPNQPVFYILLAKLKRTRSGRARAA